MNDLKKIAKHVEILNGELGRVQSDIKWIKRIGWYMVLLITSITFKFWFL